MAEHKNISIKDWAIEDRPREKLIAKGLGSLTDAELIAILIGSGSKDVSAVELSRKILQSANNNLNELGKLSINDLRKNKGIGEAKAITIIAALELGRRRKLSDILNKTGIKSSKDVADIFQSLLGDLPHEEFWILLLNRSNKIIDRKRISQGGVSGTVIDTKIILKFAIEQLASSIILCHNHPSGNLKPSSEDIKITKKLSNASKQVEIPVLDHIIVTDSGYYSFADEGMM